MYFNNFGGGVVYRLSAAPSLRRQNKTAKAPGTISQGLILRLSKMEILKSLSTCSSMYETLYKI